jgi:hypothetical protein
MPKIALTTDGNLYARFFIETGIPSDPFVPLLCSVDFNAFYNEEFYRYYRTYIYENNGDANLTGILELELYDTIGGPNIATGGTASASSVFSSTYPASKAFDGSLVSGDGWIPQSPPVYPEWLQYDFGAGNEKKVIAYKMGSYSSTTTTAARSVRTWVFQGSNDGTNWIPLHRAGLQGGWTFGEMREFPATQSFTGSHGGDTFECYVEEEDFTELSLAGTGFDGGWQIATTSSIGNVIGDDFETYTTGDVSATLGDGEGFDGSWLLGDEDPNEVYVYTSNYGGYTNTTTSSYVISEKIDSRNNDMLVLAILRRDEIIGGLEGWGVVTESIAPANAFGYDQWTTVYTKSYSDATTGSFWLTQSTANQMASCLIHLTSKSDTPITIESYIVGDYSSSTVSPGLHPIPSLTSSGDGRFGINVSSCVFSLTSATTYVLGNPWTQLTPSSNAPNRFCVATIPLSSSQNINQPSSSCIHGNFTNHLGAEVTLIFKN